MDQKALMQLAEKARESAYCPYSGFAVGAALLTADGSIYTGCNVENASYSLGCCAERTAIFKAVSEGKREFTAIAICGAPVGQVPATPCIPCGACLQVMAEFCGDEFPVILADGEHRFSEFLPKRFIL